MELRLIIAYGLLSLLVAFAVGLLLWRHYNSRERTDARLRRRGRADHERRMAERESDGA